MGTVTITATITAEDYRVLVLKAYKYDKLREKCVSHSYATTDEEILFEITDKEKELMRERRGQ